MENQNDIDICRDSWAIIRSRKVSDTNGELFDTMQMFDEFYSRLFERSDAFRSYFSTNTRKRAAVVLRILEQVTNIQIKELDLLRKRFNELGNLHIGMNIRPWMYSVFIET